MADPELKSLTASSVTETPDPLDTPAPSALEYLASLHLSEEDLELLLGEAPGLSWVDMKEDVQSFFFRLRHRVARLVCNDQALKDSISNSVKGGAEATWLALVVGLGFDPSMIAAAALKPIAVGLVVSGMRQLCRGGS